MGRGGKRGKTAGRGTKGQNARAGRKKRPEARDIIKRFPKLRGYAFQSIYEKPVVINLKDVEKNYSAGETVSVETLIAKKMVETKKGKKPGIKILGDGELGKKLNFIGCLVSVSAKEKIEKAGGSVK